MSFKFVDLFAGIGGFHQALNELGGDLVLASEIDLKAKNVYRLNYLDETNKYLLKDDIHDLTKRPKTRIPDHDVLSGGFPCQPFSKSGKQKGISETRGTLFWNILKILQVKKPKIVFLENVQNLIGPKHLRDWRIMVSSLRDLGYRVSDYPDLFSPHQLPPQLGGTPQRRDRVFIVGIHVGKRRAWLESSDEPLIDSIQDLNWNPEDWNLMSFLQDKSEIQNFSQYKLSREELRSLKIWDELHQNLRNLDNFNKFPGFPLWADFFTTSPKIKKEFPDWKVDFIKKNSAFYNEFKPIIIDWFEKNNYLSDLLPSHRKFEWQAKSSKSLWDCLIQFRPSGIRVKNLNYLPAFVAIGQTSVIGPLKRRLTEIEGAKLQGFKEDFKFGDQNLNACYKQIGNAIAIPAAQFVLYLHVLRFKNDIPQNISETIINNYELKVKQKGLNITKFRKNVLLSSQLKLIDLERVI